MHVARWASSHTEACILRGQQRACLSSCHSSSLPNQSEAIAGMLQQVLQLLTDPLSQTLHSDSVRTQDSQSPSDQRTHQLLAAKTSCTPLTSATLPSRKPTRPPPLTSDRANTPKPTSQHQLPAWFALVLTHTMHCPISRVNHLRPLDSEWTSIDERRTQPQNASSLSTRDQGAQSRRARESKRFL